MNFSADSVSTGSRRYYESVLGVPHEADPATVRSAFRDLAAKYHPDRNSAPDAARHFREIAEAYTALHRTADRNRDEQRASRRTDERGRGTYRAGARWLSPEDLWSGIDAEAVFGERPVCVSRVERTLVREPELLSMVTQAAARKCGCSVCDGTGEVSEYEQRGNVLFKWTVACASCGKECDHRPAGTPARGVNRAR